MAFPEFLQQNTMKMFSVSYVGLKTEELMMQALAEFHTHMGPNVEDWDFRLKEYIKLAGGSAQSLEVYDRYIQQFVHRC